MQRWPIIPYSPELFLIIVAGVPNGPLFPPKSVFFLTEVYFSPLFNVLVCLVPFLNDLKISYKEYFNYIKIVMYANFFVLAYLKLLTGSQGFKCCAD